MKEIRQIYLAQKKQDVRDHFALVRLAAALLGSLAAITGNLERLRKIL